jgi:hypothetical protein
MRPALPALLGLLLLAGAAQAQTNGDCTREAEDATRRVERDMARQPPSKNDTAAYQRWSQVLHEQLAAVNRRHEDCRRSAERPPSAQAVSKLEACREAALRQSDELRKRYAGRTLSLAEQTAMRNEEIAILDNRQACMQKAAKG